MDDHAGQIHPEQAALPGPLTVSQVNPRYFTVASLETLVGEWTVEITSPADPSTIVHEQTTCAWLEGGALVPSSPGVSVEY